MITSARWTAATAGGVFAAQAVEAWDWRKLLLAVAAAALSALLSYIERRDP